MTEGSRTTTRTYDALNRLASYSDGEGNTIGYTYWPSGELKTLTYPGNKTVTYTYDDFGRLWTVQDWRATNNTTTYAYWENGLLKSITRPNGTLREQSYDAAGRLRFVRESKAGALFAFQELTYDDDGRIKTSFLHPMPAAITLPLDTFGDPGNDAIGYDADNRLTHFNSAAANIDHDADGNMTRGPGVNGIVPGTANFTYDARNRLTAHGGSSYRYNPDGLRVETTGAGACTYVVDPNAALSRTLIRTQGGQTTYYIYGLGLLHEITGTSTSTYHFDQVGSTVALTDNSGTVTDRWSYAPFGTEFRVGGASDTPFRFNGEFGVMTETSGLVYMRARYYHPRLMRFCNADPIGFGGGMNWYAFAGSNPISSFDPLGLKDSSSSDFGETVTLGRFIVRGVMTASDKAEAAKRKVDEMKSRMLAIENVARAEVDFYRQRAVYEVVYPLEKAAIIGEFTTATVYSALSATGLLLWGTSEVGIDEGAKNIADAIDAVEIGVPAVDLRLKATANTLKLFGESSPYGKQIFETYHWLSMQSAQRMRSHVEEETSIQFLPATPSHRRN